jgi:hypothetical protein
MMTRAIFSGACALLCAGVLTSAQVPQGSQQRPGQPTQTEPRAAAADQQRTTTLTGCLYREDQIPGRSPNVAERAGLGEDFILADATMASEASRTSSAGQAGQPATRPGGATQPGAAQPGQAGQAGATAGLATGRMYKVTNIDDEKLRGLVGKRVEVTGSIENADRGAAGAGAGAATREQARNVEDLPELEATSIREVAGNCPPTPAGASPTASPSTPSRPTTPSTPPSNPANPPTPPNR